MKQIAKTMMRLHIYGGLITLFACTRKPGIEEIIAIRAENNNLMLAINKTVINNSIYSALDFKQVTVETLKEEIQKMTQY